MLQLIGGIFLTIGSIVGGGILAIPIVSAKFGFLTTEILVILSWLIMTRTGLYILDLCLCCPRKYNSYYSIVGKFLGDKAQFLTMILFLWLLYFSLSSYLSGCVSIIMNYCSHISILSYFNLNLTLALLMGLIISISTKFIIRANITLVIIKLSLLILVIFTIHFYFPSSYLVEYKSLVQPGGWALFLVIINAFGFQFIVPSLVTHYGEKDKNTYKWMLIISTTSVLFLYTAWLYTIYSTIPIYGEHGLLEIYNSKNQLLSLNTNLYYFIHSKYIMSALSFFEMIALFGSFFCVSLGLFDFLVDMFKIKKRLIISMLTFIPALILTTISENMYTQAMMVAGYIAIILEIIIPIAAINKKKFISNSNQRHSLLKTIK